MRLFFSAGEPSGDLHGSNLIRLMKRQHPDADLVGYGGERMAKEGCQLDYPLAELSVMGFRRIADHLGTFLRLIRTADISFRTQRPDAVVLIDYPGLNWWLAKRAHRLNIPVVYFVPPQLWAWAGWRVRKMRRTVDHVLCTMPFEQQWFAERGVNATYVGHPYFDELATQPIDPNFVAHYRDDSRPIVAVLPGSRKQEVVDNVPLFAKTIAIVHARCPNARFFVASFNDAQKQIADSTFRGSGLPVEVFCRKTPEIIALAKTCMSVSGSVSLELLNRAVPSTVQYSVGRAMLTLASMLIQIKWISLVNILANEEIFPEFVAAQYPEEQVASNLVNWLTNDAAHREKVERLVRLRNRVAQPGACMKAAEYLSAIVTARHPARWPSSGSRLRAAS